jgi:hypothetical protein
MIKNLLRLDSPEDRKHLIELSPDGLSDPAWPGLSVYRRALQLLKAEYEQTKDPDTAAAIADLEPVLSQLVINSN